MSHIDTLIFVEVVTALTVVVAGTVIAEVLSL